MSQKTKNSQYNFDISYPIGDVQLDAIQTDILRRYPQCTHKTIYTRKINGVKAYHTTVCQTKNPEEVINIANALKKASPQIFVSLVSSNGTDIYYHPIELSTLDPLIKKVYTEIMRKLPQSDRTVHDYLVNMYKDVPIKIVFPTHKGT